MDVLFKIIVLKKVLMEKMIWHNENKDKVLMNESKRPGFKSWKKQFFPNIFSKEYQLSRRKGVLKWIWTAMQETQVQISILKNIFFESKSIEKVHWERNL